MHHSFHRQMAFFACFLLPTSLAAEPIEEITVAAQRVANERPASSLTTIATTLSYDSQVELYSRGLAEGQSDITVRGSLFESTSVKLGAVVLMDPQTGHYTANLPISPEFLQSQGIATGSQNAAQGFNATVATLRYGVDIEQAASRVNASVGTQAFNAQSLVLSQGLEDGVSLGLALERSQGDGTMAHGDHTFQRINLALQKRDSHSNSQFIAARQHQFFGWPGAYTGFASLPETDHTDTTLLLANHQQIVAQGDYQVGAYYRRVVDNYDFDRRTLESGSAGAFEHETASYGIALEGTHGLVHYRAQWTGDELISSTDLTHGTFNQRQYLNASVGIKQQYSVDNGMLLNDVGLTADVSNRDSDSLQPYAHIAWQPTLQWTAFVDYARTSQLPGYTALQSNTSGLFGGNPELSRERSEQLEVGVQHQSGAYSVTSSLFWRREKDATDWTYASQSSYARQANAVNMDIAGWQLQGRLTRNQFWLAAGLTWLDKTSDYGAENVDASYYALNFAKWRTTLNVNYVVTDGISLRFDSEYRHQAPNSLRQSSNTAFLSRLSAVWLASPRHQWSIIVDNLTDDDFQMYPGTPGIGRSASISYDFLIAAN
ncbi:MAG: hypothetical protein RL336_1015 [Pseudomonadota bacterium]|jgi:outer membrane cobalamin receptor